MEKNSTTRHVAIVEKCVMTEMAWRYTFSREESSQYRIHFFKNINLLRAVETSFPWVYPCCIGELRHSFWFNANGAVNSSRCG
ncbi:hypothetical protein KAM622c_44370 [Klebsiella quasipneumoniae subsp. quasipneumoniae]|nr:hypothetical protein KAM622c_44370 [Klebsiella quasipneumoniae subsp. quasipneumoniae]